jgi:2,4-dienoyl-CoA reductase-like NADH-dependent reductase (Old Yellow Enzyme family)
VVGGKRIRHELEEPRWPTEAEAARALLFSPIRIGRSVVLEQRTWVPAMVPWRSRESGEVTPEIIAWYGRFAAGRPGGIVVEATGIRDIASGPLLRISDDRFIPGLETLVEEVKRKSDGHTRLFIQIIDFLSIRRRPPPEKYFLRFLDLRPEHRARAAEALADEHWRAAGDDEIKHQLLALELANDPRIEAILSKREIEDLRFGARERVTDMHLPHVRALPSVLPDLFARAARRAEKAGFDGVELHFAHAYTMASFLSRTNDRDDGYGGSRENRIRLPLEVYAKTRDALRSETVLGCRFLGDEVIEGGSRVEEAVYYGRELARAGMDYLSLSKGGRFEDAKQPKIGQAAYPYTGPSGHECMPTVYSDERGPFGRNLHLSRDVRAGVRALGLTTPVVAAGGITTFATAEAALQQGDADVIASARQSLADPDWFSKTRLGLGDEVRRCQLTNYCEGLDQQHKQVTCRLWDREIGEGEADVTLADDGKRRLVAPAWERRKK